MRHRKGEHRTVDLNVIRKDKLWSGVVDSIRHLSRGLISTVLLNTNPAYSFLIRREIPRLCLGGSKSLTNPGVRFNRSQILVQRVAHEVLLLTLTGCDQAPLRGQQP